VTLCAENVGLRAGALRLGNEHGDFWQVFMSVKVFAPDRVPKPGEV
jgi:hypothetical protein